MGSKESFSGNNQFFSGNFLMNAGIDIDISRQFESAVFMLELSE
jgi:alpha-galactosidase